MNRRLEPGSYVAFFVPSRPLSVDVLRAGLDRSGIALLAYTPGTVAIAIVRVTSACTLADAGALEWLEVRSLPQPIEGGRAIDLVTDHVYDLYVIARRRSHRSAGDVVAALADMNLIASQIMDLGPMPIAGAPEGATDAYAAIATRYLGSDGSPTIADPVYIAAGTELALSSERIAP